MKKNLLKFVLFPLSFLIIQSAAQQLFGREREIITKILL